MSMAPQIESRHERHKTVNGAAKPQEPPPSSILATHLAPVNGNPGSFHFDRESFAQLLQESLKSDEDGLPNLGNDITINHKLICVIVKAGLDGVLDQPKDPFITDDDKPEILVEACNCLDVIELAITRCPQVVYQLSDANSPREGHNGVPLFLWLIPRLLRFLSRWQYSRYKVEEKVWSLVKTICSVEDKCGRSAHFCKPIREFVQRLAGGMLSLVPRT